MVDSVAILHASLTIFSCVNSNHVLLLAYSVLTTAPQRINSSEMETANAIRKAKDERIQLRLESDLKELADAASARRGWDLSMWLRDAIREKLEREAA